MGSRNSQVDFYDLETREALGQAFDTTWLVLKARDPFLDFERNSELKTTVSLKLMAFAADGVTDPVELRELALESLALRLRQERCPAAN